MQGQQLTVFVAKEEEIQPRSEKQVLETHTHHEHD